MMNYKFFLNLLKYSGGGGWGGGGGQNFHNVNDRKKLSVVNVYIVFSDNAHIQLTLIVSNSVDSNFRLSRIFIEVPNFVVYKYI